MNKPFLIVLALALVAAGYYLGQSGKREPTVIKVAAEQKSDFKSSGTELSQGNVGGVVRSIKTPSNGVVVVVKDGESIQEAVAAAEPGTVIKVLPGTYRETVYIDKDNITLSGVIEQGNYPVLEGDGLRNDAVLYSGNGVTIENFYITHRRAAGTCAPCWRCVFSAAESERSEDRSTPPTRKSLARGPRSFSAAC